VSNLRVLQTLLIRQTHSENAKIDSISDACVWRRNGTNKFCSTHQLVRNFFK